MTDIKTLWRDQKPEDTVTLENIHENAAKFQRRIRLGNMAEYIACAFAVAIFGVYVWLLPGWMTKLGSALVALGVLYMIWQLHRRGGARKPPGDSAAGFADFYRSELVRRRDLFRTAWRWYILPTFPGIAIMMLGRWYQFHAAGRSLAWDHEVIVLGVIIMALIVGSVRLVQLLGASRLQRKIDELDRLREG
jgi:hypothetical protein